MGPSTIGAERPFKRMRLSSDGVNPGHRTNRDVQETPNLLGKNFNWISATEKI